MSARKLKRVSGDVFRYEQMATICSRGTIKVVSPSASVVEVIHSRFTCCNAASKGDEADGVEFRCGCLSAFSGRLFSLFAPVVMNSCAARSIFERARKNVAFRAGK